MTSSASLDVLFVIPHLGAGGTQRVATLLLNHWCQAGWRIGLLTLFSTPDSYSLNAGVQREDFSLAPHNGLDLSRIRRANRRLDLSLSRLTRAPSAWRRGLARPCLYCLRALRQGVATVIVRSSPRLAERFVRGTREVRWLRARFSELQPQLIVSFLGPTNIQCLLAIEGLELPIMISERNDPAVQHLGEPWQRLRQRVYARADVVTANSAGALETLSRWVPASKLRRVRNPLVVPPCAHPRHAEGQRLVVVARLVPQKGIDLLVDAFARVADELPGWQVDLVGDGPLRMTLTERVERLRLSDRILFHGHQRDPFPFLYKASVFILPSRFEGMPNALLEALGVGLAVVVSDASPGPLELIRDGETGLVVPADDVDALASAIRRLCTDALLRARLATAALRLAERMALPAVAAEWENAMADTIYHWQGRCDAHA